MAGGPQGEKPLRGQESSCPSSLLTVPNTASTATSQAPQTAVFAASFGAAGIQERALAGRWELRVLAPRLPLTCCVTLDKGTALSEPGCVVSEGWAKLVSGPLRADTLNPLNQEHPGSPATCPPSSLLPEPPRGVAKGRTVLLGAEG